MSGFLIDLFLKSYRKKPRGGKLGPGGVNPIPGMVKSPKIGRGKFYPPLIIRLL